MNLINGNPEVAEIGGSWPIEVDPGTLELEVLHETCYEYEAPVSLAHHLAYLRPLTDAHQVLISYAMEVNPPPALRRDGTDVFGNAASHLTIQQPHRELRVLVKARMRVTPRFGLLEPEASPDWEEVRDRLLYVARAPFDPAVEFAQPSPYVPRLEALREYALPSFPSGRPLAAAALDLMHRLYADFRYEARSTEIDTPLAEAFAQRRGVCQDFAHLMVGSLRMLRLPARYVSGYLRTGSGVDPLFVGADASHAWVQVYAPGTPGVPADGWLDLDPTNDLVPASGHVRLAVGRDFGDVAPLRGVIRGGGHHKLTVGVTTRLMGPASALASRG